MRLVYSILLLSLPAGLFLYAASWFLAVDGIWWFLIIEISGGGLLMLCCFGAPVAVLYYQYVDGGGKDRFPKWLIHFTTSPTVVVMAFAAAVELIVAPFIPGCPLSNIGNYCVPASTLWTAGGISGATGVLLLLASRRKRQRSQPL